MSQIDDLENRITAALERIGQGVQMLEAAPQQDNPELEELRAALDDERTANAQLEERLAMRRTREEKLTTQMNTLREDLAKLDGELQKLRKINEQLRENNDALRRANQEGVGEPHLINKSMLTELEALRAARSVDRAETTALVNALEPLLAEHVASPDSSEEETA